MAKNLFNSSGEHIAVESNNRLYKVDGGHIGDYLTRQKIFVNTSGSYLGEIYNVKRLVYKSNSPYRNINYGSRGSAGSRGSSGNAGNIGSINLPAGYEDVSI